MAVDTLGHNDGLVDDTDVREWIVSVDDHAIEPAHTWESRLPRKYQDAGPRYRRDAAGWAWFYEDKRIPISGEMTAAGEPYEKRTHGPVDFETMDPACYDPVARVAAMDKDHELAALVFPTMPRFCGQTFNEAKDRDLALLCVRAYNDWLIEEWAGSAPTRLIPGALIIPLWDGRAAAVELERCAALGGRAFCFSEMPHELGLPSIHSGLWDPVFSVASDTGMVMCTHLGSSSNMLDVAPDGPKIANGILHPVNLIRTFVDWVFSGKFEQFPGLMLALSEGGIGWMPYMIASAEKYSTFGDRIPPDAATKAARARLTESPREVFRKHIFGCFITDDHGVRCLDEIGIDNVMIETDFPHASSEWPNSWEVAQAALAGLSGEDRRKIMQGNARRLFRFEPERA